MAFHSLKEIEEMASEKGIPFWRAVMLDDLYETDLTEEESLRKMKVLWRAMLGAGNSYDGKQMSRSGLVGGMGQKMKNYRRNHRPLSGDFVAEVTQRALAMGECNACMKRIVAAPTAGACGVLPSVLLTIYHRRVHDFDGKLEQELTGKQLVQKDKLEEKILECLYVAAGIGQVIAARAFIAGAAGGCQAEIGSASCMTAGALVHYRGGTTDQILNASAMALQNLLGLVCDPVAGLVEVPCVQRNVVGAVNALTAADMALAGIRTPIPADQVIDSMREVGEAMHVSLKETGEGGTANTPWAREFTAKGAV